MATGLQVEQVTRDLASGKPATQRNAIATALVNWAASQAAHSSLKSNVDTVVADAATAGKNDYGLEQIQTDWGSNLQTVILAALSYGGETGISALAEMISGLSEHAGLNGTANELRLYKNGVIVPVTQDA